MHPQPQKPLEDEAKPKPHPAAPVVSPFPRQLIREDPIALPPPVLPKIVGPEIQPSEQDNYLRVTAERIVRDLMQDEKSAYRRYNRPLQVEGIVKRIISDEDGMFIEFRTSVPYRFALLGKKMQEEGRRLAPGDHCYLRVSNMVPTD